MTDKCKTLYLYCPDGTIIEELEYDGYGTFGGQDAYALLARWNLPELCNGDDDNDRGFGIDLFFTASGDGQNMDMKYPLKFSFSPHKKYEDLPVALYCETQGFIDDEMYIF